ncbi:hypothetical protein SeMB42_g03079 [Synchytrium endobioticum]|nr:hypothetical protein SeMB42_g03079 [Synchytrium endobioticum]
MDPASSSSSRPHAITSALSLDHPKRRISLKAVYTDVCRIRKDSVIAKQVDDTFNILVEALERYGTEALSLSFNGGKDCMVMVHVYMAALYEYLTSRGKAKANGLAVVNGTGPLSKVEYPHIVHETVASPPIKTLYVRCLDPFKEVDDFVEECAQEYNLDMHKIAEPMKEALQSFLDHNPSVQAILIGTRRTDPHAQNQVAFDPTDNGWPNVMRVHPILDWEYVDIWTYLKLLHVDYCRLYDKGYTSLGGISNTMPNPALRKQEIPDEYLPAYMLQDASQERNGRRQTKRSHD